MRDDGEVWTHNSHHHPVLLAAVPAGARRVLDAGCGAGLLARQLQARSKQVVALDRHDILAVAAAHPDAGGVDHVRGDLHDHPFRHGSFDAVTAVAVLHHGDTAAGLRRLAELVRPGGTVAVIGLARSDPTSLPWDVVSFAATWLLGRRQRPEEEADRMPIVWPPPESYRGTKRIAEAVLPGCEFRPRLYFRYTIVWTRPPEPTTEP
jgi:SAM-dependent methyltransferase